ncbi:hypothetical protein AAZX31_06G198000 [Glycine max]|uniref:Uncharacterized protein n=2 Tax=Glycine subgen. Soja TaxID=1462606 RepID=K7KWB5_SOYBN|nr:hypothetical protein JHK87_015849 [Glycine soja]KAG5032319.1 hypothetical protein JHK85_016301 [Glycine max]KAG5046518.1 hypothetical protein JHK86_015924 [Glycine max]KAG5149014.1 hypothetical protein JHK82_015895 [Glycine max]KAH1126916.1 hypothetical protein GYH30_015757 [Glycine max]
MLTYAFVVMLIFQFCGGYYADNTDSMFNSIKSYCCNLMKISEIFLCLFLLWRLISFKSSTENDLKIESPILFSIPFLLFSCFVYIIV